jgi:hypothetical protein
MAMVDRTGVKRRDLDLTIRTSLADVLGIDNERDRRKLRGIGTTRLKVDTCIESEGRLGDNRRFLPVLGDR